MNFVVEWLAVEAFSSETGPRRVTALDNEARYHSVENNSFIVAWL